MRCEGCFWEERSGVDQLRVFEVTCRDTRGVTDLLLRWGYRPPTIRSIEVFEGSPSPCSPFSSL